MKKITLALLLLLISCLNLHAQTSPALSVTDTTVMYGQLTFEVPITFESDSTVSALQFDLLYDNTVIEPQNINTTTANHLIHSNEIIPGIHRILVYSPDNDPIEGAIIITLEFSVLATGVQSALIFDNIVLSDNSGTAITPASTDDGLVTLNPLDDSDNDGMPDSWETNYYPDISVMDDTTDSDNDGCLDKDEYQAGTDPTDNESLFKVMCPQKIVFSSDNEGLVLTWTSRPEKNYKIFWKDNFSSPEWDEVSYTGMNGDVTSNPDNTRSWTDMGKDPQMSSNKPLDGYSRFYKIVIDQED